MIILTNPAFGLLCKRKAAMKGMLNKADDYVILGTWTFCNATLCQQELIMPEEWPGIYQTMGLSVKHLPCNRESKPDFYIERTSEFKPGFYLNMNTHYSFYLDKNYHNLMFSDFTKESLVRKVACKAGGHYYAKGTSRSVYIVPKKDYSQYEEQIFIDTIKWKTPFFRAPLIRKEFTT